MSVLNVVPSNTGFIPNTTGVGALAQQTPTFIQIQTNDVLSAVLVAGYLNKSKNVYGSIYNNEQMALVYTTDQGPVWLKVSISGVNTSLVAPSTGTGEVTFTGVLTAGHVVSVNNASGIIQDAGFAAAQVMQLNVANTMAAGGSIVLLKANGVEAANAVTANGQCGVITTSALTTAGGASYAITWTNSSIATTSVIGLTIMGGTNTTEAITLKATAGSSTSTLTIYNNTASTALNGTILIGYTVF